MKKTYFFLSSLLFVLIICLTNGTSVLAINDEVTTQNIFYSNNIMDAKEITVDSKNYTAILSNDVISIFNNEGKIIKTIDYIINEYSAELSNYAFHIIDDIDGKGIQDFLIILNNKELYTISYEDDKVLWKYIPTMKSTNLCGTLNFCDEEVEISHYEIYDDIYISAGYLFQKISMKTGNMIKEYQYDNNIWYFSFISDINNNQEDDIALAVQPSTLVFIDGKSYSKIKDLNIIEEDIYISYLDAYVKPNIINLEFFENENLLLAASEDGFIHEINVLDDNVDYIKRQQFFSFDESTYSRLISTKENEHETTIIDNKVYYSFSPLKYKTLFNIYGTSSFDSNDIDDYVVEFNPGRQPSDKGSFILCSQDNPMDNQYMQAHSILLDINNKFIAHENFMDIEVVNLKTQEVLLSLDDSMFDRSDGDEFDDEEITTDLFILENSIIVNYNQQTLYKFDIIDTNQPVWSKSITIQNGIEIIDDRMLLFNGKGNERTGFSIVDEQFNTIFSYNNKNEHITNHVIEDDKLYVYTMNNAFETIVYVVDIKEGILLVENNLIQNNVGYLRQMMLYDDVNKDGISEIIARVANFNDELQRPENKIVIYDLKNKEIIEEINEDFTLFQNFILYKDVNDDQLPEIVFFSASLNTLSFEMYLSDENEFYSTDNVQSYIYDVIEGTYDFYFKEDLNNDGYEELIFNSIRLDNDYTSIAYIIDFTKEELIKYENTTVDKKDGQIAYYNILSIDNDLDHDGIKEIVTIEADFISKPSKTVVPYQFKIFNYDNGVLVEKFNVDIIIPSTIFKGIIPNLVNFKDLDNDGIDEVIFSTNDTFSNMEFEIYDYKTNNLLNTYKHNLYEKTNEVTLDQSKRYYQNFYLQKINNVDYILVHSLGRIRYVDLYFNLKTFELTYILDHNCVGSFKENLIFYNNDTGLYVSASPIKNESIHTKKVNNTYYLELDDDIDIKTIEITSSDGKFTTYTSNNIKMQFPNGNYHLLFKITAKDGAIYYYYDVVNNTKNIKTSISEASIFVISIVPASIGSKILINKRFRIKEEVKNG